jgi:hypothetical protein
MSLLRWQSGAVVVGCRENTAEFVDRLLSNQCPVAGIVTISQSTADRNKVPSWLDLSGEFGQQIPVYVAHSYKLEHPADVEALSATQADVGFCIGWQRLLPQWFLNRHRNGVFGMHACANRLPNGRGRSPINWSVIEAEQGVQSTFFLLQTSDYNPFEEEEAVLIRRILDLGHDLGLHYDAALFERLGVDPLATAKAQIDLFETFFRTKIQAMSSHMPMRSGKTFSIPGVIDTYDPMFLTEMKYISDSTQAWREGVVTENLEKYNHIHLLTHEYIWHPFGWDWSALLFSEAQDKFQRAWKRAEDFINMYREGLKLRAQKDKVFKERYMNQQNSFQTACSEEQGVQGTLHEPAVLSPNETRRGTRSSRHAA